MNNYAQVMNKSLTGYAHIINKLILLCHEQAMSQPCAIYEKVEKVVNHEKAANVQMKFFSLRQMPSFKDK